MTTTIKQTVKRISLEIPNHTSTKSEEIAIITKLVDSFAGTGSYAETTFSKRFLECFSEAVKEDYSYDPAGIIDLLKEDMEVLTSKIKDYQNQGNLMITKIAELETRLANSQEAAKHAHSVNVELREETDNLRVEIREVSDLAEKQGERIETLEGELTDSQILLQEETKKADCIEDELNAAKMENALLKQTILTLKAEIYDLMIGNGKE